MTHADSYGAALANCLRYFEGDELAASVMVNKYLARDREGNLVETEPKHLHKRIADEFARIESTYPNPLPREVIDGVLDGFKYIVPQGSPLSGIGNMHQATSLGNCFCIGSPEDSWGGICRKDEELAQIMKRRGGVGIDLSTLRPAGSTVANAARSSDGVPCFMEKFSNTTKSVAQGGRRGALMITLDCRHPDIERFVEIKRDLTKVTGANVSVKWTDEFMLAVEKDDEFMLQFPVDVPFEKATCIKPVKARALWNKFVEASHACAEPGCLFWDRVKGQSLSDLYDAYPTVGTNPCSELPLSEYGSCILMVVNLLGFIQSPFTPSASFDERLFSSVVQAACRLIDDMVDLEMEKIRGIIAKVESDKEGADTRRVELAVWQKVLATVGEARRVGLGVTGLGDMLAALGMRYGSDESIKFSESLFSRFHAHCMRAQAAMAKERGPFVGWSWDRERDSHYISVLPDDVKAMVKANGRRNISFSTCPPAGSISLLTRTTSGIEPVFMRQYERFVKMTPDDEKAGVPVVRTDSDGIRWRSHVVVHPGVTAWLKANPGKKVEDSPYWGCQANELDWRRRVSMQAAIQKYITHSISSTVNLPATATVDEVSQLYLQSWREGCKGATIYRDGSRQGVMKSSAKPAASDPHQADHITITTAPQRPKVLDCDIHYSTIEGNEWVLLVGKMKEVPYEIFGGKKAKVDLPKKFRKGWLVKNGRDSSGTRTYDLVLGEAFDKPEITVRNIAKEFSAQAGSYTRIISAMLRHGIPLNIICEQLHKDGASHMFTFEKGAARVLKKYISDGSIANGKCESCGGEGTMQYRDGCVHCCQCGASKCQ